MKKFLCVLLTIIMIISIVPITASASAELTATSQYDIDLENIGMGGGGQLTHVLIDPTNSNNYYAMCDMGGLYSSKNSGESWDRIPTDGYINAVCSDENGDLFMGGYGLYKSVDGGRSLEQIYPKNVHYTIRRCGWNEKLMLSDGFDNGYILCVATYGDTLYFATADYLGNARYMSCDKNGDNIVIFAEEFLNASPTTLRFKMVADDSGIYYSTGYAIRRYNPTDNSFTEVFSTQGFINDFVKIDDYFFILDDYSSGTKILYTNDFVSFSDLTDYNTLPNYYIWYGYTMYFTWRFQRMVGSDFEHIYFVFSDPNINNADGILKFNGTSFEWVFEAKINDRMYVGADGWSFGSVRPVAGFCIDPNDDEHLLLSVETVYDIHYKNAQERSITTTHSNVMEDGTYETTGLDVLATYAVNEDPFDSEHIIINCADVGLQNSFNGGKSFVRATIQGDDYARYNSCYDLYFDKNTQGKIYALWSSIHEVPCHTDRIDKKYATGYLAVSYDGGYTWDFEYSDLPENSIPFKMSVVENGDELFMAVATYNNGFFVSYDSGRHFESISEDMDFFRTSISGYPQDTADYIFGLDVKTDGNKVYCLTNHYRDESYNLVPSKLYEYDVNTKGTKRIDLGNDIIIARSLTFNEDKGLFVNVCPYYTSRWLLDLDTFFWFNYGGGVYKVENYGVVKIFENEGGVFNSGFAPDGKMYVAGIYGDVYVEKDGVFEPYVTELFKQLMYVSFSNDGKKMYVSTCGGGTYRMNTLQDEEHVHSFTAYEQNDAQTHAKVCDSCGQKEYENHDLIYTKNEQNELVYRCVDCGYSYMAEVTGCTVSVPETCDVEYTSALPYQIATIKAPVWIDNNGVKEYFVYWKDSDSGEIIGTYNTYSFYLTSDMNIEPVFVPEENYLEARNTATISSRILSVRQNKDGKTHSILAEHSVAKSVGTIVGHGILFTTDPTQSNNLTFDNENIEKRMAKASKSTLTGLLEVIADVGGADKVWARSFVLDADNNPVYGAVKEFKLNSTEQEDDMISTLSVESYSVEQVDNTEPEAEKSPSFVELLMELITIFINFINRLFGVVTL